MSPARWLDGFQQVILISKCKMFCIVFVSHALVRSISLALFCLVWSLCFSFQVLVSRNHREPLSSCPLALQPLLAGSLSISLLFLVALPPFSTASSSLLWPVASLLSCTRRILHQIASSPSLSLSATLTHSGFFLVLFSLSPHKPVSIRQAAHPPLHLSSQLRVGLYVFLIVTSSSETSRSCLLICYCSHLFVMCIYRSRLWLCRCDSFSTRRRYFILVMWWLCVS